MENSVELNLNKNNIMWDFIYPIKTHAELYCNGKVYNGNEIKKFKFFSSEQKLQLAEKQTTSDLPNLIMNRNNATEVTRELLEESKDVLPKEEPSAFSNEVFIVHGHDSTSEYELV